MFSRLLQSEYRLAWLLAAIVLILLLGWFMTGARPSLMPFFSDRSSPEPSGDADRISASTRIEVKYACEECFHPEIIPNARVKGLNRTEFSEKFPHLEIVVFSRDRVLAIDADTLCPAMEGSITLLMDPDENRLAVRYGIPDHLGPPHPLDALVSELDLPPLGSADRQKLLRGVRLESESDLWSVLEGLGH